MSAARADRLRRVVVVAEDDREHEEDARGRHRERVRVVAVRQSGVPREICSQSRKPVADGERRRDRADDEREPPRLGEAVLGDAEPC